MTNKLEMELSAVHSSIAEIKRRMDNCVNVKHYEELQKQLESYEKIRLEILKDMGLEL